MKRFIRFVCLLLILSNVLVMPAAAAGTRSIQESSYFASELAYLVVSGTDFDVWFDVTAKGTMKELGASSITVQRSSNNSNWTDMETYSKDDYPELVKANAFRYGSYVSYSGSSGYYYRAKVWFYAKNDKGTGSVSYYTDSVYIE